MSVIWEPDHTNPITDDIEADDGCCFYCFKRMSYPAIVWMGNGGSLLLHPECSLDLNIRLIRDYHDYQRMNK